MYSSLQLFLIVICNYPLRNAIELGSNIMGPSYPLNEINMTTPTACRVTAHDQLQLK